MKVTSLSGLVMLAVLTCLFFGAGSSNADTINDQEKPSLFHGLYAGGVVGYANFDTELEFNQDSIDGMSANDFSTGIFAGTGTIYEDVYFGFEGHLTSHNADFSLDLLHDLEGEFKESFGASARIGTLLSDNVLAYALGGWQRLKIEIKDNNDDWSDDNRLDGFRLGAGVEYQTTQNVFIRGEYTQTFYSDENFNDIDVDPNEGHFQIGIGFRF